ncbi:Bacterial alpha-L-rhamnosidase, partial [Candidatus Bathyarchaeota archaeon]|nr:Bacterial alpha-L-rhamnosidase [Candidatus Bathyarchaeota archaeon]
APCKHVILEDETIVYHFKENNAGWVEIAVQGKLGQIITIEMNELLNEDGHVDMHTHAGHTHGRFQTCEYICNGNSVERWHPSFTYAGFQYVQVTGIQEQNVIEILACQVCTDLEENGNFHCSHLLVNRVNEASKLTFLNGFHSYPEDCPQREKAGWTEDGLISSFGSVYNYNCLLTYEKWIQDILDAQHVETGQVPAIVPTPGWGKPVEKRGEDFMPWTVEQLGNMADPWWGGCIVLLPWHLYQHYGDSKMLEQAYPAMKAYVDFLLETTRYGPGEGDYDYMVNWPTLLGDWLEVGSGGVASRTPRTLTASLAFLACVSRMAKSARVLGCMKDEERYHHVAGRITSAFNEEFLDEEAGSYWKDSQSAQAMPLMLGIVPKNVRRKVVTGLVSNVMNERDGHLSTGIVGTYFLYKALGENRQSGIALNVITARGKPGFEHMLTRVNSCTPVPSGTIWEDWDGRSSLAHPVQGTVVSFLYEHLAGIQVEERHPGFEYFTISPSFIPGLRWVRASIESLHGSIDVSWERGEDTRILLSLRIPANTTARLDLQGTLFDEKGSKQDPEGLTLGSGAYQFTIDGDDNNDHLKNEKASNTDDTKDQGRSSHDFPC